LEGEEKKLYIKLAYGYYQNKEYKKALDLYEKIYKSDTDDFNVLNMLADTYVKLNIRDKAIEAYVSTIAILERKEQHEKVIRLCKKAAKAFPDDQRVKSKLKNSLRFLANEAEKKASAHEYSEARVIFENLAEFNSDDFPVNIKLKELNDEEAAYTARSRRQEESKKAETPQDTQKDLISKFDKMAQNYISNGDFDGAVETYITALKLAPGNEDLRAKLHKVYLTIAQESQGEKIWEKLNKNPVDKLEEAKRRATEERQAQIMKEEEERAMKMIEDEAKIQSEYEAQELAIIQAAAGELKHKLEEAQKDEKLKEEEIQRITKEQEEKKRELLEKLKREAVEKFNRQKEAIRAQVAAAQQEKQREQAVQEAGGFVEKKASTADLMENLKKAYEKPKVGAQEPEAEQVRADIQELAKDIPVAKAGVEDAGNRAMEKDGVEDKKEDIIDDIGEAERNTTHTTEEIVVNDETLDSLITMSYIYINQGVYKEAMRIHNKLSEKYPDNREVKGILEEITKRQGS
jgi:tetratricopeptide (TPR) repeat protein